MKKFLSLLMTVALTVACLGSTVFAAGTDVAVSTATAEQGDEVTLEVSISGNPGFVAYKLGVDYDKDALELTSIDAGSVSLSGIFTAGKDANNNFNGNAGYMALAPATGDGVLFTVTFKVLAVSGTYPVSVNVGNLGDANQNEINPTVTAGSVTVKHEHNYTNWTQTTAPTCTQPGIETGTCACGATTTRTGAAATGHSYGEYTVTTEPTCTEKGVATATCSVCGATTTKEVAATGHTWGEWEETKAPTCTEAGEKVHTCTVCGATVTAEVAATGHNYEDGKCTDCGAEEPKTPATDNKDNNKDNTNNTVQTGDNASVTLWVALMAVAVAGVVVVIKKRRVNG